jgi:transcriptional regulator with XRE-family HTH domain
VTTDIQAGSPPGDVPPAVVAPRPGAADTQAVAATDAAGGGDARRDAAARLRSARRERGWSLEELSQRTCIKAQRLAEIEQGRVDSCGPAVYARGHRRAIASALRIDPQPVIEALVADESAGSLLAPIPAHPRRAAVLVTSLGLCLLGLVVLGCILA